MLTLFVADPGFSQTVKNNRPLSGEERLVADIELSAVDLTLKSHPGAILYEYQYPAQKPIKISAEYRAAANSPHHHTCFLRLHNKNCEVSKKQKMVGWSLFDSSEDEDDMTPMTLTLTDSIPVDLNLTVCSSKSTLDFSGIMLSMLNLNIGAGQTLVRFARPNPVRLKTMQVSTGASQLKMTGLGRANFDVLQFSGGATDVVIDFDGTINREVKVNISLDAGSMKMFIPKGLGVKINHSSGFFSNITLPSDFYQKGSYYLSSNSGTSKGILNISVASTAGAVTLEWK
ncbi:MAG: cell wall-active antibiotics response protein [Chlorobiales bacterium]|nr:cell wall-active antibiotics response protein [Chlorobiales bacterium]